MPDLPFQVGELIESKCFQVGYRGAWFRSKIRDVGKKGADMAYLLEYPDYPDNKPSWIKLYQKPRSKSTHYKELVVRPHFPTIYHESEKLDVDAISQVIVIVNDTWKVGDLVDWFTDGCYWCGEVTEILGNNEVQVDLLPHPLGEGSSYKALSKDLRPSLDWCPDKGWTVPIMPMEDGCRHPCARIINPAKSGGNVNIDATDGAEEVGQPTVGMYSSQSPQNSVGLSECLDRSEERRKQRESVRNVMEIGYSDMDASIENLEMATINSGNNEYPVKKMRSSNSSLCLNSMSSNTIDAAILDLEELVNRVKWLKDVLNMGVPPSGIKHPSWKFLQHHAPCK